jgi:hypothetical protein
MEQKVENGVDERTGMRQGIQRGSIDYVPEARTPWEGVASGLVLIYGQLSALQQAAMVWLAQLRTLEAPKLCASGQRGCQPLGEQAG